MKQKKGKVSQAQSVQIGDVAKSLPIDHWFSIDEFSQYTGIKRKSAQQRINCLVDDGYLEREKERQTRNNRFRMSAQSKKLMIEKGIRNNRSKFPAKITKGTERRPIEFAIAEAYKEHAERILKAARFM